MNALGICIIRYQTKMGEIVGGYWFTSVLHLKYDPTDPSSTRFVSVPEINAFSKEETENGITYVISAERIALHKGSTGWNGIIEQLNYDA